jgi:predicted DNA binding CopG/RHH family protein
MTKKPTYDDEELDILQALEAGTLKSVADAKTRRKAHQTTAEVTLKKDQRLNIRISSRDLKSLQARAVEEGIPYQTLAASLLHKYVNGHLVNQR